AVRGGGGGVRGSRDNRDECQLGEGGGQVEWLPVLLRVAEPARRMGSRLIRAAVKPEGDSALREGRDDGLDAVRPGVKLDGACLDTFRNLLEDPHRRPQVPAPQLGPAARQLGAELMLNS